LVDYEYSKITQEGYMVSAGEGGQGINEGALFSDYQLKEYEFSISKCKYFRRGLDIGGCYGIQSIRMAKDFVTVEAFEPLFYKFLEYNTKEFDNVNIHPYALSSSNSTATMRVGVFNAGGSNITYKTRDKRQKYEEVETRTLDSFGFTDVDFIKIDVEGHEWIVLESGFETAKQCNVFMIEIDDGKQLPSKKHRNYDDIHMYFEERGFRNKRFRHDTVFWKE